MNTITAKEAGTDFEHYLAATCEGRRFIISLNEEPVAMLVPISKPDALSPSKRSHRPRVGETLDAQMTVPESAFAPMTEEELKLWYGE